MGLGQRKSKGGKGGHRTKNKEYKKGHATKNRFACTGSVALRRLPNDCEYTGTSNQYCSINSTYLGQRVVALQHRDGRSTSISRMCSYCRNAFRTAPPLLGTNYLELMWDNFCNR